MTVDKVLLEVLNNRFAGIVEEMRGWFLCSGKHGTCSASIVLAA